LKPDTTLRPIVLVEDDAADAKLLIRKFGRAGVNNPISHLTTGDQMLAYVNRIGDYAEEIAYPLPVLIILDLKLPGITGLELLPVIRRNREWKVVPIVVLTSDEDERVIRGAYELGANSYLVKSADEAEVLRMAERIRDYWLELNRNPQLVIAERA